ncbi:MAG: T9SS type A sorting domain-containing protein [Bacteroidales bacterium]
MKKLSFIFIIIIGFSSTKTTGQIRVNPNGYVGINNLNPSYGLDIHAKVRFDNWSDFYVEWNGLCGAPTLYPERDWYLQLGHWEYRLGNGFFHGVHSYNYWEDAAEEEHKGGFEPLSNVLFKLNKINGIKYHLPDSLFTGLPGYMQQQYSKERFGFVTEELETTFPQLVVKDDSTGKKYVNYTRMIPILVEAIKQQQKEIEYLYSVIKGTPKNNAGIDDLNTIQKSEKVKGDQCLLFQNEPNPFDQHTSIKYHLAGGISSAVIYIFDLQGKLMKAYSINQPGQGAIVVNAGEFKPGMYIYTMIADGKEIDTKRMILTD